MPLYNAATIVKELRKSKGLTQENLCAGICSKDEISRIERNIRRPCWFVFEKIMQRLGEDPQKYFTSIASIEEMKIIDIKNNIQLLLRKKTEGALKEAEVKLEELSVRGGEYNLIKQHVMYVKSVLAFYRKDFNAMLAYAKAAVILTRHDFNENKTFMLLTMDEIIAINNIALAYFNLEFIDKAVDILLNLKSSLDIQHTVEEERTKIYIQVTYNLTKYLGLLKRYDESILHCDEGIHLCEIHWQYYYLPLLLGNKMYACFYLNRQEEGKNLAKRVIALFEGLEKHKELAMLEKFLRDEFGLERETL
ncbi:MAG: helix-turn-helix transcriptional regulator [Defluviitaleaceae bacterium]|nr:helix-turn-helix transcriptional regulator [Defluviitaleaceae bacterium]